MISNPNKIKPCILIVEDDEGLRQLLVDLFEDDFHVLSAEHGLHALRILADNTVDLILSDISMPHLNGIGLLKALKKNARLKHIPVIVISAYGDHSAHLEALKLGANDYITKPFNIEHIALKARNFLERSTVFSMSMVSSPTPSVTSRSAKNNNDRFVTKYEQILNLYYADPDFTIESCAKHMTISERQLQRRIKEIYMFTPVAHLKHFRLIKSRQLLLQGFSISYTYQAVGLTSQSHFSRAFKSAFGITPKQVNSVLKNQ